MEYVNYYKQMRMFLIYDLPTTDEEDQRIYQRFHNQLIKLGFYMLQYSVYIKVVQNDLSYKQYINKINNILPINTYKYRLYQYFMTYYMYEEIFSNT